MLRLDERAHLFLAQRPPAARERRAEDARVVQAQVALEVFALGHRDALRAEDVVEGGEVDGLAVHQHAVEVEEGREHGGRLARLRERERVEQEVRKVGRSEAESLVP